MNNRPVAVKEMLDSFSTVEERRAGVDRFLSEIAVLESFRHPNIPRVMDHFFLEHDKKQFFYFVMEYVQGTDLSTYLKQNGYPGIPEKQVMKWALQVLEALEYLHSLDPPVVHRDIKPSNLLLREEDQRILLIDFGIARVTNPGEGYWIGTPGYAPPEQQLGRPEPRSDFYALAAAMHELLTGKRPEDFNFPAFKDLNVKVSDELDEFIAISLEPDPEDRAVNASEMNRYLRDILKEDLGLGPLPADYRFEECVLDFKEEHLDPLLQGLIQRYGNEAHTRYIPRWLDYMTFTLACPTNFDLVIRSNYETRRVEFYEKQGILEKRELGQIDPADPVDVKRTKSIINRFVGEYEKFKSANWGGGEGFIGFGNIMPR
jgi:serine/threonine protein kinase